MRRDSVRPDPRWPCCRPPSSRPTVRSETPECRRRTVTMPKSRVSFPCPPSSDPASEWRPPARRLLKQLESQGLSYVSAVTPDASCWFLQHGTVGLRVCLAPRDFELDPTESVQNPASQ